MATADRWCSKGPSLPETFVAFFAYVAMVIQPMRSAGTLVNMVQRGRVSAQRLFEILDLPDEITDTGTHRASQIEGALHFNAVTARYAGAPQAALRDLALTVAPGEVIALMGPVGAGKSTLLALLPRLLEPEAGTLTLDGTTLADWPLNRLRQALALVPQMRFSSPMNSGRICPTTGPTGPPPRSFKLRERRPFGKRSSGCPRASTPEWGNGA